MLSNRNKPSALDVVVRIAPVATFLASIEAPGTAASPGSVTVPCKVAVVVWAKTLPHKNIATQSPCAILLSDIRFILLTSYADCLIVSPQPRSHAGTASPAGEQPASGRLRRGVFPADIIKRFG